MNKNKHNAITKTPYTRKYYKQITFFIFSYNRCFVFFSDRILGRRIQNGPHSSVEDATVAMDLYKRAEKDWHKTPRYIIGNIKPELSLESNDSPNQDAHKTEQKRDGSWAIEITMAIIFTAILYVMYF